MTPVAEFMLRYGIPAFVGALVVLSWPRRRERSFVVRTRIAAPRRQVWVHLTADPGDPAYATLFENTVSSEADAGDPAVFRRVIDHSGGHRTNLVTIVYEVLGQREPERLVMRLNAVDDRAFPFGEQNTEIFELADRGDDTALTFTWRGETATWWQFLMVWRGVRRHIARLKRVSERGPAALAPRRQGFPWKALALSATAFGSFAILVGWLGALFLAATIAVHEFGHWLAFRVTGHPAPRFVLIPFLGGVAVGNHPHRTRLDEAFVALMGPAFSILPCAAMLAINAAILPPFLVEIDGWAQVARHFDWPWKFAGFGALVILVVGAVNALQLLPVLPLDGGQVLRAVLHSTAGGAARRVLLAVTAAGFAGFVYLGDHILAAILALGLLGAWHMETGPAPAHPMRLAGLSAIIVGYVATFAIHIAAVAYGLRAFDLDLRLGF